MKDARGKEIKVGDVISIPLNGEEFHDEQICLKYDVILAFKPRDGGEIIEAVNEMGYLLE